MQGKALTTSLPCSQAEMGHLGAWLIVLGFSETPCWCSESQVADCSCGVKGLRTLEDGNHYTEEFYPLASVLPGAWDTPGCRGCGANACAPVRESQGRCGATVPAPRGSCRLPPGERCGGAVDFSGSDYVSSVSDCSRLQSPD